MHPIVLYLLKMLLCSGLLYAYYRAALYNERFHQWNRFYLLGAVILSIVLPLVEIPLPGSANASPIVVVMDILPWNNAVTYTSLPLPYYQYDYMVWISLFASLVSLVFSLKLFIGLGEVYRNYRHGKITTKDDVKIIITENPSAPYSFFHWLFWRADLDVHSNIGKRMLQHELTHIRQKHTIDKFFMESLLIFGWMNPFFWLIRKELYMIHEFLADRNAIEQHNGSAFAEMIMKSMHLSPAPAIVNPFFNSQIERRLHMITSDKRNEYSYLRRITTLFIGALTIFLIACKTNNKEELSAAGPVKVVEGFQLPEGFNRFSVKDFKNPGLPEGTLIYLDGKPITLNDLKNLNPDLIDYDVLLDKEASIKKYGEKGSAGTYELYSFPVVGGGGLPEKENLPSFPGGNEGWTKYLQQNLRYPDIALDKGTTGVVKISCTIIPDGTVEGAFIVENPGDGLGEEALRIITNGPKWIPAKVNGMVTGSRIIVPITFMLE